MNCNDLTLANLLSQQPRGPKREQLQDQINDVIQEEHESKGNKGSDNVGDIVDSVLIINQLGIAKLV